MGEVYLNVADEDPGNKQVCRYFGYGREGNFKLAKMCLNEAFTLFSKINDLSSLSETSFLLYRVYLQLGDERNALHFYIKYTENKDTIFSRDNSIKILNIEKNREIELRDKQIRIQELEIKSKVRLLYLFIAITMLIVLISVLFIMLYLAKRKANRQLAESEVGKGSTFFVTLPGIKD